MLVLDGLQVFAASPPPLVEDVSLQASAGRCVALIGESGSGKSLSALSLVGALPDGLVASWRGLMIDGVPIASPAQLAPLRGRVVGLMPQDANAALDPVMRVGAQVDEVLSQVARRRDAGAAQALFREVGLDPLLVERYPHELSGGMRQRVVLAMTLAGAPKVLLADEPTSALDASLAKGLMSTLQRLMAARGLALVLITHDLWAVEALADDVAVIYSGRVIERAPKAALFASPRHPYTRALLSARLDRPGRVVLQGAVPSPQSRPVGCPFRPRCARAGSACGAVPAFVDGVACHHPEPSP